MAAIVLNGITWGHSRGITPLLALSQRYSELHPGVEIRWKKKEPSRNSRTSRSKN